MAITYAWEISSLDCYPQYEGLQDVVGSIRWLRVATDGTYNAEARGVQHIKFSPAFPFTPFSDLTAMQIYSWLENSIGAENINKIDVALAKQIEEFSKPVAIARPIPWTNP